MRRPSGIKIIFERRKSMSKKMMWIAGIAAAIVILIAGMVGIYNSLVAKDVAVTTAWAQVESQYQRRMDLLPNLVNSVKGYAKHERDIFTQVANARARLAGATTVKGKIDAAGGLDGALSRLLAIAENYPNLKADANFRQLMDNLEGTENRIAVARMRYNEAVQDYNTTVRRFPTVIFAGMFGFEREKPMFAAAQGAEQAPEVKF